MTDLPKSPDDKSTKNNQSSDSPKSSVKSNTSNSGNADKKVSGDAAAPYVKKVEMPKKTESKSTVNTNKKLNEKDAKPAKTGLLWFVTLINLIILILLCVGVYWYYTQIYQTTEDESSAISELDQKITQQLYTLQSEQQSTRSGLNSQVNSIENAVQSLSQTHSQATESLIAQIAQNAKANQAMQKRLAEISGRRPSDWLLAEANYLVNMAGRKLYLEKDIRTAITLLQEADARLLDLNDPALFPVRALIAGDIQSLKGVNTRSTSSIALTIAGMLTKASELPLNLLKLPESEESNDLTLSEDISDWRENLSRTWKSIVGPLYRVSDLEKPLEPYLEERQQWLIEQQVKHALAQAQSAVLAEQQALYVASLQTALSLLNNHYKIEDASVNQFITALQELQNADFTRNLPVRLESQTSLKDVVEMRIQNLFNNMPTVEEESSPQGSQL